MIPGCTHAVDLALDDKTIDLNQASDVYVTLKQGGTLITLTGAALDVNGYRVTAYMTQDNSLKLKDKAATQVQINWLYTDPEDQTISRCATEIATIPVGEQLLRRVLP